MNEIVGILWRFFCFYFIFQLGLSSLKAAEGLRGFPPEDTAHIWGVQIKMGNIESVDGQSEMKHHIMPLKVPMPDPTELEEKFAIVLVSLSLSDVTENI